jgi:acetyltransferase
MNSEIEMNGLDKTIGFDPNIPNYPKEYIEFANLRDGTSVLIRPIRPDDAPRLQEAFALLSPETIFLRFLGAFHELTDEQAAYFANVDYLRKMALVGSIIENNKESIIAVARYHLSDEEPKGLAECAIVVRDDYQGRGLGTIMLERLSEYAKNHGVIGFRATVHVSNQKIMYLIKKSKMPYDKEMIEPGIWDLKVWLNKPDKLDT